MSANDEPVGWNKAMQALATVIHWFAPDKAKVANHVFDHCRDLVNVKNIGAALREAIEKEELHHIYPPEAVERFLKLPEANLNDWTWWAPIQGDDNPEGIRKRRSEWEGVLRFRTEKELLLYPQRDFLANRFADYEPARKDLWDEHNRPSDFDHILASQYFYNKKGGLFRSVCRQWGETIGNFRAWPLEDNRSDQAQTARLKLSVDGKPDRGLDEKLLKQSFIEHGQVDAFSGGDGTREDEDTARKFAETCRSRLLRIYREWYESVDVAALFASEKKANQHDDAQ
jgi:hypothetical protein